MHVSEGPVILRITQYIKENKVIKAYAIQEY
jgi:hypothetical protein